MPGRVVRQCRHLPFVRCVHRCVCLVRRHPAPIYLSPAGPCGGAPLRPLRGLVPELEAVLGGAARVRESELDGARVQGGQRVAIGGESGCDYGAFRHALRAVPDGHEVPRAHLKLHHMLVVQHIVKLQRRAGHRDHRVPRFRMNLKHVLRLKYLHLLRGIILLVDRFQSADGIAQPRRLEPVHGSADRHRSRVYYVHDVIRKGDPDY
mmetsp:Transcript_4694/g.8005  ORF Transcript_4694/g.8005 Transcript_4694/m.8005 type:complete len:207 (-) Transcript_4694:1104-1724(-)